MSARKVASPFADETRVALEALKRLADMRMPPTPPNFQTCYNEIAGIASRAHFPATNLRRIVAALPAEGATPKRHLQALGTAIEQGSWNQLEAALIAYVSASAAAPGVQAAATQVSSAPDFVGELAHLLEALLPSAEDDGPWMRDLSTQLLDALRKSVVDSDQVVGLLNELGPRTRVFVEEQKQVKLSLLKLLHLIVANIGELGLDESWLKGQADGLLKTIESPLELRHLDSMERRLHDVISRQSAAKRQAVMAQAEMRNMLATFVASLAAINKSSTAYQEKMERCAEKIEKVQKIEELAPLLGEVIASTRLVADESAETSNRMKDMQARVEATEAALAQLYQELESTSAQARHDPLTDALNRKGLDDALAREIAAVRRRNMALSVCLLDIDNFKKLNDHLGHAAGDKALIHLANVTRRCMRPSDTLARWGGEEFVILMPDTPLADGIETITRLQRSLTKEFFLAGAEKVLITFSAGVAQCGTDEDGLDAINRADKAMYLAKRAGKNRVMGS